LTADRLPSPTDWRLTADCGLRLPTDTAKVPTPSDLFVSPDLTEEQARDYLQSLGFRDAAAVDAHLQRMADDLAVRQALGRLAPDLLPAVLESPDPDAAVAAIAQYVAARSGRGMFLDYLREDPRALHVLAYVMGASPHLAEILIRTPEYFHWLVTQIERSAPDRQDHEEELVSAFLTIDDPVEGFNLLRRWKRREILRIGARDLLRHETVQTAAAQLSDVASVAIDFALAIVMQQRLEAAGRERPPGAFAVIATGSLGGREMSYGDDIDVLYVYDSSSTEIAAEAREFFVRVGWDLTAALKDETRDGFLYRASAASGRRPHGWPNACSLAESSAHYAACDDMRERLALVRARPVAGDADLGGRFMEACQPFVYGHRAGSEIRDALSEETRATQAIEELTQAFQVAHGAEHTALRLAGTLTALEAMAKTGLLGTEVCHELDHAYVFHRTGEHRRQLGLLDADTEKQVRASQERVREICNAAIAGLAD
jgi:[glutamine synthetase] adenylyltransferase / [glutamine synthetase]-adenylyl-L-tyrosine phosphorylase